MVAKDEREGGLRRILNFGHTLGHGLEAASHFKLPHGRAVAWGMLAALSLSDEAGGLALGRSRARPPPHPRAGPDPATSAGAGPPGGDDRPGPG